MHRRCLLTASTVRCSMSDLTDRNEMTFQLWNVLSFVGITQFDGRIMIEDHLIIIPQGIVLTVGWLE